MTSKDFVANKQLLKFWKTILNLLFAVLLVLLLVVKVDWHFVLKEMRSLDIYWLSLYLLLQLVAIFFSVKKWQALLRVYDLSLTTKDGFLTYLKGMFLNNFLPTTIGGDAYRCWWLGEKTGARAASYASVVLDRILGLFVTMVMALLGVFFMFPLIEVNHFFGLIYLGLFLATLLAGLLVGHIVLGIDWIAFREKPFFQKPFFLFLLKKRSWGNIEVLTLWSGLFSFVGLILSNYVLFLAFGMPLSPLPFSAIMLLVILFSNLPVSINNIGIKEWSYATFFVYLGVPLESAVAVALFSRILQMGLSMTAVPLSLFIDGDMLFATKPVQKEERIQDSSL